MANAVPPGFAGSTEPWTERLRGAAYRSPKTGTRIEFKYENVSREVDRRGTAFQFPGVDDAYVQQTGHSSRRYPLRCFFWGREHDKIATAFESALLEPGIGRLEHPLYGAFSVVPFGTITRRDDLKTAANQTIIEVTFWTTVLAIYPSAQSHPKSEILAAIENFDVLEAQRLARAADFGSVLAQAEAKATFRDALKKISAALSSVSNAVTSVNRTFRSIQSDINLGMDVLIGQPLLLARQVQNLIKAPGRALSGIRSRLDAYGALADDIFGSGAGDPATALGSSTTIEQRTQRIANDFHIADLIALSAVAGSVLVCVDQPTAEERLEQGSNITTLPAGTVTDSNFTTKPSALEAADILSTQFDDLVAWRDGGIEALEAVSGVHDYQVDTGEAIQALQSAVSLTIGFLVEISFTLIPERRIVLDRARTAIDLSAELYGSVDDKLDFLIESNGLTGDEILEIPANRTILYYPD